MARIRSVDFLPEIFQTPTNRQFLSATLDQMIQEPKLKRAQGFIGRRNSPGATANDRYIVEPTDNRRNYQLEPSVVFRNTNDEVVDTITYPGMIDALALAGGNVSRQDRLWESDYYSWDPFVDLDKLVNYGQYYWVPAGPDSVDVFSTVVPLTDDFVPTAQADGYSIEGFSSLNPPITLVRGGSYNFNISQNGQPFYIQAAPGIDGRIPSSPNISSRDVMGVVNNGEDLGTVTFNVPLKDAQAFYYDLTDLGDVDFATNLKFTDINNQYLSQFLAEFGGIDDVQDLDGRTVIFLSDVDNAEDGGWQFEDKFDPLIRTVAPRYSTMVGYDLVARTVPNYYSTSISFDVDGEPFDDVPYETVSVEYLGGSADPLDGTEGTFDVDGFDEEFLRISGPTDLLDGTAGSFDSLPFDGTTDIPFDTRYSIWRIQLTDDGSGDPYITLVSITPVSELSKVHIISGTQYSSYNFYRNAEGYWEQIPLLTAALDTLYYQDSANPSAFGIIRLIDAVDNNPIRIDDIVGKTGYVSPNGVTFTNGLKVQFRGSVIPSSYVNESYYVEGVGSSIQLIKTTEMITPETYTQNQEIPYDSTPFDIGNYGADLNQPMVPDYITINRGSLDLNAWTRSNRWFHVDVLNATAAYNGTVAVLDQNYRAKRPIIEFRAGLRLFNNGTQGKQPVDVIDFVQQDAFSNVNGSIGYSVDGYTLLEGTRIIFANDQDLSVRNKIYVVSFISPDTQVPLINEPVINLTPATDAEVLLDQSVVVLSGVKGQGKSYRYNGTQWALEQQKTSVNQPPLFDVYDKNNFSLSNNTVYPSTTFTGTKLFSYKLGLNTEDAVLGFPLSYLNINNVGDILFENNLYSDTFLYVIDGQSRTENISIGNVRDYSTRTDYQKLIGWQRGIQQNISPQIFNEVYLGEPIRLDVTPRSGLQIPAIKIFVDSEFLLPSNYSVEIITNPDSTNETQITFLTEPALNSLIEIMIISDEVSATAYYAIPLNLESNPLNKDSTQFTLGGIRSHYSTICENNLNFNGIIVGENNSRDLGNIIPYGTNIVQQSSPVIVAGAWLRDPQLDIFNSLAFNAREYEKYKALLMDATISIDVEGMTSAEILDECIGIINQGRTPSSPFYWSDMLPWGTTYTETVTTITPISTNVFDLNRTYNFETANYYGLLVYLNGRQLLSDGHEYTVATDGPRLTIDIPLAIGDVVTIREYETTIGNYCPNTPSKMGLYPTYLPMMYLDTSYVNPTMVIRGHDGSITVAFGDVRDDVLMEFERRVYNNIKVRDRYDPPLDWTDVYPGRFRDTGWSNAEITEIIGRDFLAWDGYNKLDYKTQDFYADNEFTWNYSSTNDKIDGTLLRGAWRGVYFDYYDTDTPNNTPWEMLGFPEAPDWWQDRYGPAPYTSGNLVLWEDLEAGIVADPNGYYVVEKYKRPGLSQIIPVDSEGNLVSPFVSLVKNYDELDFKKSWAVGDMGPVETVWRRSSSYPFAVMRTLALTKPAEFFSLFIDLDRYRYDSNYDQYLYDDRYRLDLNDIEIYGNGTSKNSFINWTVDWNRNIGITTITDIENTLSKLNVQLAYRMASYSNKKYIKLLTEKSAPRNEQRGLLIPDESYDLLLYRNQPFSRLSYSAVIVQKTDGGYAVTGYGTENPYFEISVSLLNGNYKTFQVNDETYRVSKDFGAGVTLVPYGYVFTTENGVVDFLNSYGNRLQRQGMIFEDKEDGYVLDWERMSQEFINWSNQNWAVGSVINLNPCSTQLRVQTLQSVADPVNQARAGAQVLDQNKQPVNPRDILVNRYEDEIQVSSLSGSTINYINLTFTAYEHLLLVDNTTVFGDLIYDPITGVRQDRLTFTGFVTYDWNGLVDAQGFILNQDNLTTWQPNQKYTKGQLVRYKDSIWAASRIIEPADTFDFSLWIKSDYEQIQKGLLPNIATKSEQLRNIYDKTEVNLESDADLMSYNLIGYQPRKYMQDVDLDDISQVNVYSQFLGTKGTRQATDLFTGAALTNEVAEYNIFENWAILRATYGANANRTYVEFSLDPALLQSNPSTLQVVMPQETSDANQSVLYTNFYKQSKFYTNNDIFPTTLDIDLDRPLPTAGYVNENDVDYEIFSFDDITELDQYLNDIGVGDVIWVAKINNHDWNIYRTNLVIPEAVEITDNLNGRSVLTFNGDHDLAVDDYIVLRFFDDAVDGIYQVRSVPDLKSIVIDFTFTGDQTTLVGVGTVMVLETMRVAQPSDISNLSYSTNLRPGDRAWVNDDGAGRWAVYEKQQPFRNVVDLKTRDNNPNEEFGASVAQSFSNLTALVGAPSHNSGTGGVFAFVKTGENAYEQSTIIEPVVTGLAGLGNAVDIGNSEWMALGASASDTGRGYVFVIYKADDNNAFEQTQLLVPEIGEGTDNAFGHSLSISKDERWLYVGSPGLNRVYAYNRVDVQTQRMDIVSDGVTFSFNILDNIVVDTADQLVVTVDNIVTTDFTYLAGVVRLTDGAPEAGVPIVILRRSAILETGDGSTTQYDLSSLYTVTDIQCFSVKINGELQRPKYDYDFGDESSLVLDFVTAPVNGAEIQITAGTYWRLVDTLESPTAISATAQFGLSLADTTDGRHIMIAAPRTQAVVDSTPLNAAGSVYVYDRSVERFICSTTSTTIGPVIQSFNGPVTVTKNGQFLLNTEDNIGGEFTVSGSNIILETAPAIGDIIEIETNNFTVAQLITSNEPQISAQFGYSQNQCTNNCSLYVGSPFYSITEIEEGIAERYVNQARVYGVITGTVQNPTLTAGNSLRINNIFVTATGTTVSDLAQDIIDAAIPNVTASVSNGYLTIRAINTLAAPQFNKLEVLPGITVSGDDLVEACGFELYKWTQRITNPVFTDNPVQNIDRAYSHFGKVVTINDTATTLVVSAPDGTAALPTTFDNDTTTFDAGSTLFTDTVIQSGVVYTFNLLNSAVSNIDNPGKFVFGQQIVPSDLGPLDYFGTGINLTGGVLMVGAPGYEVSGDDNTGKVYLFLNANRTPAWNIIRQATPRTNTQLMNSIYIYDRSKYEILNYLDFIDPLQGKILGAAQQNLNYIGSIDPANYNTGTVNNNGQTWREDKLGEIWWNTSNVRFVDYNQNDINYDSRRWGQVFPGSTVDVYQWIQSDVPPAQYAGPGTPVYNDRYSITSGLNVDGSFVPRYFFWVTGLTAAYPGKSLSTEAIKQYIENPVSSGISYAAVMNKDSVALYNCGTYVNLTTAVLHVEFDQIYTDNNVHIEYDLVGQGDPESFLTPTLYRKMQDSLCGTDTLGNKVPDPFLSPADLYGVAFRPRQSMVADRFLALENYLGHVNTVLLQYPIREFRRFDLLNSRDPEPGAETGQWDLRVIDNVELSYQNLAAVPTGYRYLVASDITNNGFWAIYTRQADQSLTLTRVQIYDTRRYWFYTDWYQPGFSSLTKPGIEVATYSDLSTITATEGLLVKVTANSSGLWEIYEYTNGTWVRRALQNGTIQFSERLWNYSAPTARFGFDQEVFDSQYFDQEPVIETRKIIQSINQELLIDELALSRNSALMLFFEYIMSEQVAPDWLFKTSLVNVEHKIRDLLPYPTYRIDNQDFVESYLNEVKPFHVQVKEFRLRYDGTDAYGGDLTDFDVPAFYSTTYDQFVSPILDNSDPPQDPVSSYPSTAAIWQTWPYDQWFDNYKLSIQSVTVISGGSGYTVPPVITVTGEATRQAQMTAQVNSAGQVINIVVNDPGQGYVDTPVIEITGGNGTGARAVAVMGNDLVRSIKTVIKYDRYQYVSNVVDWTADTVYQNGQLVRYNDRVYAVTTEDSSGINSGTTFDLEQYTQVPPEDLTGVDRTMGYYVPDVNQIGLDLAVLISGVDYPGVQVHGPGFDRNTGFDVGDYDFNPFDNIDYGPEGRPSYDPAILDAIYSSSFLDIYLGTQPTDVNVDGGAFVDTYSSHAPEELVPGITFDCLDMRVFARPGADWLDLGWGWPAAQISYVTESVNATLSWDTTVLKNVATMVVVSVTAGVVLYRGYDYTVDWSDKTITLSGVGSGETITILMFGIGGGNQLEQLGFVGSEIVNNRYLVNATSDEIKEVAIVVNGEVYGNYTVEAIDNSTSYVRFNTAVAATDWVAMTVMGYQESSDGSTLYPDYGWSSIFTETAQYNGSTTTFSSINDLGTTNASNMVVEINGTRLRPPEGAYYVGNGSTVDFFTSTTGEIDPDTIANNEIVVYVDSVKLTQGSEYIVQAADSTAYRTVTLATAPAAGAEVEVYVSTETPYTVSGNSISFKSSYSIPADAIVAWKSFGDTSQQGLRTKVFKGPGSGSTTTVQPYDSTGYDDGLFDQLTTTGVTVLIFDLETSQIRDDLAWVTFNGEFLKYGEQFSIIRQNGNCLLELTDLVVGDNDIIAITWSTPNVVAPAIAYRINQDMLGQQLIYRINDAGTTVLTQPVYTNSTVIYVEDVSALPDVYLELGQFGVITINGERITYREKNTVTNSVTGLRRGVAGTGIANHAVGSKVYNLSTDELLPAKYQNIIVSNTFTGDGSTSTFATDFSVPAASHVLGEPVMVFVGGTLLLTTEYTVTSYDTISVTLDTAPPLGVQVTVAVREGYSLYQDINGVTLAEIDDQASRFLRG